MRKFLKIAGVIVALYAVASGVLLAAMYQPPDKFGAFMAKMPKPFMYVLPFPPLWKMARAGQLRAGDMAPDFSLETVDKKSRVELASFRGQKPVVLVFGSYT
ncbi:MAG: hypothetical protein HYR58_02910 [Acidobacteria bacterium]|nr:hypothetical protein [Acidobacteriota bacterium]MBI3484045.1 hypothetical protein [Acidobacteriota bacterium]